MPKKVIISEEAMKKIIAEEYIQKKDISNLIKNDKELEKKVRSIVADSIATLFKTLWQRNNFYDAELRK